MSKCHIVGNHMSRLSYKHVADSSIAFTSPVMFLFLFDFDWVCSRLHGLIRACVSDSIAFSVAAPFIFKYGCSSWPK